MTRVNGKSPGPGAAGRPLPGWVPACLQCVAEHKIAAQAAAQEPAVRPAVTIAPFPVAGGIIAAPLCYEHITAQKTSPILAAR